MNSVESFNSWLGDKMSNGQTRKDFLESRWGNTTDKVISDIFWAYTAGYSNRIVETRYREV